YSVRALEAVLASGPVSEAQLNLPALSEDHDFRRVFHRAYIGEEAFGLLFLNGDVVGSAAAGQQSSLLDAGPVYRVLFQQRDVEIYRGMCQQVRECCDMPHPEGVSVAYNYLDSMPISPTTGPIAPVGGAALTAALRGDAYYDCIAVALALYRYQLR